MAADEAASFHSNALHILPDPTWRKKLPMTRVMSQVMKDLSPSSFVFGDRNPSHPPLRGSTTTYLTPPLSNRKMGWNTRSDHYPLQSTRARRLESRTCKRSAKSIAL